ncbi:YDG domain-containing protein [Polaromonas sp. 24-63-21]|uniref:beta strand repeat-containing protein n=1 Tax=Polaromonas sp. 24-63-21 TaxID=1970415 RepID=UPI0025E75038|nr:YDG domain-containing protein [Polaromonas sp. 24-63-21]
MSPTLGALSTAGGTNGNGGAVSVTTTGTLSASTIASTGGAAIANTAGRNAGVITISTGGAITALGNVSASGSAGSGASQPGGNAAAVSLTSVGGITAPAATVTATGGAGGTGNANGGNAAAITVSNSGSGAISLGALAAQTGAAVGSGTGGTAGSISVSNSAGNLTTGTLTTTGGASANGGNITLAAVSGTVVAGNIAASGGAALGSSSGHNGGTINISGAALTRGASTITANGTNASTLGAGGNGGAITLSSTGAISGTGAISAIGGNGAGANQAGGNGAAVSVSSTGGSVAAGAITTTGGNGVAGVAAGGNAGAITLDAAGAGLGITLASNLGAVGGSATGGAAVGTGGTVLVDAGTGTYTQNKNIDVAAGSGPITVIGDTVAIGTNTGNNALATSGALTIKAKTANRAMSLAGASAFDISGAEITAIATGATGSIVIGDTASSGVLTVGNNIGLSGKTLTLNAGSITDTGTQLITATHVTLNANGNIGSSGDRINVAATNLGVNTTAGGSAFVATGAINMGVGTAASNVTGTLDLLANGAVTQTASTGNITAGTLKVQNSAANSPITLTNSGNNAGTINLQATSAGAIQYTDVNGFDVAAVLTTGNATLSAGATVTQSGAISASGLALTGTGGNHTLRHAGNAVTTLAANTGSIDFSQAGALTVGTVAGVAGVTTAVAAKIETTGAASDLTLANAVTSNGTGDAIVLKAGSSNAAGTSTGGKLVNSVGASGIVASAGRYLAYSGDPATTTEGMAGYNKRYNTSSSFTPGGSANMFLYRIAPTLTISADNATRVYGDANPVFTGNPTTGLIDGDTDASVGVYRSTSAVFNTPVAAGPVTITPGATNSENYTLVLNNGLLSITRRSMPRVTGITAYNKVVDGNTSATLNTGGAGFPNLVAGDVLHVATATGNFDNPSVGGNKTVYITGISLGGAAADNYTLMDPTATTTASITDLSSFAGSFFQTPTLPPVPPQRFAASGLTVADANALLESSPTASGGGSGTTVKVVREPTDQEAGLVTVTVVSELVTAGKGFRFSLPPALLAGATKGAVPVEATTLSGRPLPAWLRYDAQAQAFVAAGVPSGALPLQIRVSAGARSAVLTISQAQGDGSPARRVIVERLPVEPIHQPG